MIYVDDHEPAHVHVFKGDTKAKINLRPVALVRTDMKARDARKAIAITEDEQEFLWEKWIEIHG